MSTVKTALMRQPLLYIELYRVKCRDKWEVDSPWTTLLHWEKITKHAQRRALEAKRQMSSYAFLMKSCREQHKKQHSDVSVNFSEFFKKCSERWKTMGSKQKGKSEDRAKADKVSLWKRNENKHPSYKGNKKEVKDPSVPYRPPSAFLFSSDCHLKIKEHPGLCIGDVAKKLGEVE